MSFEALQSFVLELATAVDEGCKLELATSKGDFVAHVPNVIAALQGPEVSKLTAAHWDALQGVLVALKPEAQIETEKVIAVFKSLAVVVQSYVEPVIPGPTPEPEPTPVP